MKVLRKGKPRSTMKLSPNQLQLIVERVLKHWKQKNIVTFKDDEKKVLQRGVELLKEEIQKEVDLDREVMKKLDELEKSNPGEFQRHKMFQLMKVKMAKEKKVVL
jgi:hypothetical protein